MDGCVVMACHEKRKEKRENGTSKEIEDKQELLSRVTGKD